MQREGEGVVVRQAHLIAVVLAFVIGCAFLLMAGASGVRAESSQEKQGHNEATEEQGHSGGAAEEEDRCGGTRLITTRDGARYLTNDVPGCPNKGGLLSDAGSICGCALAGKQGDDEIHGRSIVDELWGGSGSDVLYGGPDGDFMYGTGIDPMKDEGRKSDRDVFYGGGGSEWMYGGKGADVFYGGDGNDHIVAASPGEDYGPHKQRDKIYCGAGKDEYWAGPNDYVDSSCEKGQLVETGGPPLLLLAGAALCSALMMLRYMIRSA
jgi:Ca2+-binding RTX toxin-like protein